MAFTGSSQTMQVKLQAGGLPEHVRGLTDCVDAAGNTTAAIGKGLTIGSGALVSPALSAQSAGGPTRMRWTSWTRGCSRACLSVQ